MEIRSKWAETAEASECLWGLWLFKNCKLTWKKKHSEQCIVFASDSAEFGAFEGGQRSCSGASELASKV